MEQLWIIGDEFADTTAGQNLMRTSEDMYTTLHFDVRIFSGNYRSEGQNVLGRMRNALTNAYNNQIKLPKWVVLVFEADIINKLRYNSNTTPEKFFYTILKWLMNEHNKITEMFKDMIPQKSKKYNYPRFLWLAPSLHYSYEATDDTLRRSFIWAQQEVQKLHNNMVVLHFKQSWDPNESNYYMTAQKRMTQTGLNTYWRAVDRTIRFADVKVSRNSSTKSLGDIFLFSETSLDVNINAHGGERQQRYHNNHEFQGREYHHRDNQQFSTYHSYDRYHLPRPPPRT